MANQFKSNRLTYDFLKVKTHPWKKKHIEELFLIKTFKFWLMDLVTLVNLYGGKQTPDGTVMFLMWPYVVEDDRLYVKKLLRVFLIEHHLSSRRWTPPAASPAGAGAAGERPVPRPGSAAGLSADFWSAGAASSSAGLWRRALAPLHTASAALSGWLSKKNKKIKIERIGYHWTQQMNDW